MAREQRRLAIVEPQDDMSIVLQLANQPVYRSEYEDGIDYVCGSGCGQVLVERTIEGQVVSLGFGCHRCNTLNVAPPRDYLLPFPVKRTRVVPLGIYRTAETHSLALDEVVVGETAAQGYVNEMGHLPPAPLMKTEPESITRALEEFPALLGESFHRMERQDARRVQQGQKHEQYRHPLMVLIARARKMARSMFTTRPEYDLEALNLLGMILGLYRQFSHNPVWRSVQRAAVDEHNFTHDVMMLAFVSQTFSFENGINVRIEEQHRVRFADARIVIGPQSVIGVEVKTHHLLRHSPEKTLTLEDADEVMNECFGSANTKTGGQLRDDHPGFLVIGNLELSPENMQSLMKAALRKFDKSAATRQHIYGVGFVWFEQKTDQNVHPYPVLDSIGFRYPRPVIHTGTINFNYVENPHYTGTVHIKIMPGSRSSLIRV